MSKKKLKGRKGETIIAEQGTGYGKYDWDLKDEKTGKYIGAIVGIQYKDVMLYEVQQWEDGKPTGSRYRPPLNMSVDQLLKEAARFVS